jgi:hypothetical protein
MGKTSRKAGLEEETLLVQLEELAQALDVDVRYEPMRREGPAYPGGLCKLKGKHVLIIDSKAATRDKIQALARAAARFDLSRVYLRPGVRDFLQEHASPGDPPPPDL